MCVYIYIYIYIHTHITHTYGPRRPRRRPPIPRGSPGRTWGTRRPGGPATVLMTIIVVTISIVINNTISMTVIIIADIMMIIS